MSLQYLTIIVIGVLVSQSVAAPDSRIVNGYLASNYQFPWHVSLTITIANTATPRYCGGSLIGPQFILTAASCLVDAVNIQAELGSILFSSPFHAQTTTAYIKHHEFQVQNNQNNIAIIRLQQSVSYAVNMRAIALPGQSSLNDTFVNAQTYISGFGVWQFGQNYLSENLRFAHKTVIPNDQCRLNFNPTYIRNDTMCTMGINSTIQSGCYGDQGGALVTSINGTWYQIGLISTLHSSGCSGWYPVLHTRIAPYVQWIYQLTGIVVNP